MSNSAYGRWWGDLSLWDRLFSPSPAFCESDEPRPPDIGATLPAEDLAPGDVVPVRIGAAITEVGTLELHAIPRGAERRWKVELEVRDHDASERLSRT